MQKALGALLQFQSTPLLRAATLPGQACNQRLQFQSTPLLRAATQDAIVDLRGSSVSIHAALASGDAGSAPSPVPRRRFNPRRSCERRPHWETVRSSGGWFQSTPLLRAATHYGDGAHHPDGWFQSTPLLRAATRLQILTGIRPGVSIHAALASGDRGRCDSDARADRFNPRRSCERRPAETMLTNGCIMFQSTPLLRAATSKKCVVSWLCPVSIHAALASGDVILSAQLTLI